VRLGRVAGMRFLPVKNLGKRNGLIVAGIVEDTEDHRVVIMRLRAAQSDRPAPTMSAVSGGRRLSAYRPG
jgi:hypothetical protein